LKARLAAEKRQAELARRLAQAQAAAARVRPAIQVSSGSGGGSGASVATAPAEGPGKIIASGSWVCPVQGPHSFTNDWGAPRGGGTRGHQGTDIFAPGGTPTVAPTDGTVFFQDDEPDGGLGFYVTDAQNNTYYGAHLSAYVGGARSVKAGEIIGRVGNTGDAAGGPTHLHFEIRVGGPNGTRINPYPTLAAHC